MSRPAPSERERSLEKAARDYGRRLAFGEPDCRRQVEALHADLQPELGARLDAVERLLGPPRRPHTGASAAQDLQRRQMLGREWRSRTVIAGWPLVHVAQGIDPDTGRVRVARGWIAVGNIAVGGLAIGGLAIGGVALGGLSLGLVALGGCVVGGFALGGVAVGAIAVGGLAIGWLALGGLAIGHYAAGGGAIGTHILTARVRDPEAQRVVGPLLDALRSLLPR